MIGYFPDPYPDELVYSQLARYYVKSGYSGYVCVAEDLFQSIWTLPSIEFLNAYQPEVYRLLGRQGGMKRVILDHTMFPVYGRFLPPKRKQAAFHALLLGKGDDHYLLPRIRGKKKERYLRYCPVCIKADKDRYGETYWHRMHQIYGLDLCPKHLCRLYDSTIPIHSKTTPGLMTAEEAYQEQRIEYSTIKAERDLASYVYAVMKQPVDLLCETTIREYLHSVVAETEYASPRGEHRYLSRLFSDLKNAYHDLPEDHLTKQWMLQKILQNDRFSFIEICMVAQFLKILPVELASMKLPEIRHEAAFDAKVQELHEQGLKYPEIARRMKASINVVKPIGERRYTKKNPNKVKGNRGGRKANDWEQIDKEMLPAVKETVKKIYGGGDIRPQRVTRKGVAVAMNLPDKHFDKMPSCKAEIDRYSETKEQYWAREIVWAAEQLLKEGERFNYTALRQITNITKENMRRSSKYLIEYTDNEMANRIRELLV